ncbi:MAG: WbqC family protein [Saprospiraceae bacterium]
MCNNFTSLSSIFIEIQVFPSIYYFKLMLKNKLILEAHENYQKRSYRNRYYIGSTTGKVELSIPLVKGKNKSQNIKDVLISYETDWQRQHLKTIQSCYGNSAFYNFYKDELIELFRHKIVKLWDWNIRTQSWIADQFNIAFNFEETLEYKKECPSEVTDFRNRMKVSGSDLKDMPSYYQVHSNAKSFIRNLSALDLLFHLGPEALHYLNKLTLNLEN